MLLLLFAPQPAAPSAETINLNLALSDLYPKLNATASGDLVYWTATELFQWFDEAAQRLARTTGVFVVRDTSVTVATGTGSYALPAAQVSTIQADLGGVVLRPRNVQELEALDATWTTTQGPPSPNSFVQDTQGVTHVALYPIPGVADNAKALGLVLHVTPATISSANPQVSAPTCLREYFTFYALAEARAKECKAAMQEVAQWMRQLTGMYEQVIEGYWGEAQ